MTPSHYQPVQLIQDTVSLLLPNKLKVKVKQLTLLKQNYIQTINKLSVLPLIRSSSPEKEVPRGLKLKIVPLAFNFTNESLIPCFLLFFAFTSISLERSLLFLVGTYTIHSLYTITITVIKSLKLLTSSCYNATLLIFLSKLCI